MVSSKPPPTTAVTGLPPIPQHLQLRTYRRFVEYCIEKTIDLTVHRQHLCIVGVAAAGWRNPGAPKRWRQPNRSKRFSYLSGPKGFRIFTIESLNPKGLRKVSVHIFGPLDRIRKVSVSLDPKGFRILGIVGMVRYDSLVIRHEHDVIKIQILIPAQEYSL